MTHPVGAGSRWSYSRGCRCGECRAAASASAAASKAKRLAKRIEVDGRLVHPNPHGGHGSYLSYKNYGCHCEPCTQAQQAHTREQNKTYRAAVRSDPRRYPRARPGLRSREGER